MQIEVFTIADAATVSGGKLNMLGSFDRIVVQSVPAIHPACCIVCKVRLDHEDSGDHSMSIHIIDPDGTDVIPPAHSTFSQKIDFGRTGNHTQLWNIQGFLLSKSGEFYVDLRVDEDLLSRFPLYVLQDTQRQQGIERD